MQATSKTDGQFHFVIKRSTYNAWRSGYPLGILSDVSYRNDCRLVVTADGFGTVWRPAFIFDKTGLFLEQMRKSYPKNIKDLNLRQKPVLRLVKDDVPVVGRLVDPKGQPIDPISMVDMYSLLNITHQTDSNGNSLFADISHPNQAGYNIMGNAMGVAVMASVPEPHSYVLCAGGMTGLLAHALRKRWRSMASRSSLRQ